jgi:t-SNARE complex subunit (syntaxin)
MAEENPPSRAETGRSSEDRIVKSATEARQGQIVLGKYSHLIWIASIAVIVILALVFWSL